MLCDLPCLISRIYKDRDSGSCSALQIRTVSTTQCQRRKLHPVWGPVSTCTWLWRRYCWSLAFDMLQETFKTNVNKDGIIWGNNYCFLRLNFFLDECLYNGFMSKRSCERIYLGCVIRWVITNITRCGPYLCVFTFQESVNFFCPILVVVWVVSFEPNKCALNVTLWWHRSKSKSWNE